MNEPDYTKLRDMIAHCQWTFAKTMPKAAHEYIVKDKCPLTEEEFHYFVNSQRQFGEKERWGKNYNSYLYIDNYKYWTMEAPLEETKVINRAKVFTLEDTINLIKGVNRVRSEAKENVPYYANAIAVLNPDEPKVSLILSDLFKHKPDGKNLVLEHFIHHFFKDSFPHQINKPIIEVETEVKEQKRIDILIYEKGRYAIIIENKIWDAPEQPNQLSNYIDSMKEPKYGFAEDQIYVVYLTSTRGHGPTSISWDESYKMAFAERYRIVSFREDMVSWLQEDFMNSPDDLSFNYSRLLFLNFLIKKFIDKEPINMEHSKINEFIQQEFGLKENDNSYNIALLESKIYEAKQYGDELERMRREYCYQVVKNIYTQLEQDYPEYSIISDFSPSINIFTGLFLPYKSEINAIRLLIGFEGTNFIYGATYAPDYRHLRNEMQDSPEISYFYSKEGGFKRGSDWLFFKSANINDGYSLYKQLFKEMKTRAQS